MTAFRNGRPGARLGACLGLLAIIGQLLLPILHAQQWADRADDGRLAIFCGELSPALLAKLADSPVPEILKQFQGNHGKSARLACALCVVRARSWRSRGCSRYCRSVASQRKALRNAPRHPAGIAPRQADPASRPESPARSRLISSAPW